jgi:hypothetical protein
MKTISYAITVCNEYNELIKLINVLHDNIRLVDEIIVVADEFNTTDEVKEYLDELSEHKIIKYYYHALNNDFASHKNFLNSKCRKDYIFQIDADEYPTEHLLKILPIILEENDVELILVPRINIVNNITGEHIGRWGWNIGKLDSRIESKIIDTDSDEYKLLKNYNLIISEEDIN